MGPIIYPGPNLGAIKKWREPPIAARAIPNLDDRLQRRSTEAR